MTELLLVTSEFQPDKVEEGNACVPASQFVQSEAVTTRSGCPVVLLVNV